jgi:methylmalonyl-CoA mutase
MINQENQGKEKTFSYVEDFPIATYEAWYDEVVKGLKGVPFEKALLTQTPEGITLKPLYTLDDVKDNPYLDNLPGCAPYMRNSRFTGYADSSWAVEQDLDITDPEKWNKSILEDLYKGQNAVYLQIDESMLDIYKDALKCSRLKAKNGLQIGSYDDLKKALKDIEIEHIRIDINAHSTANELALMLSQYAKEYQIDLKKVQGSLTIDPVSSLAKYGKLPYSWKTAMDNMAELIKWAESNAPQLKCIHIDGTVWNNAGSSANQELAYCLATAVLYIREMLDRGLTIDQIAPRFIFSLGIGNHVFMEISKLRAMRILWAQIIENFEGNTESQKTFIYSKTSDYNKTCYDPWVNILRTSTEAFAAIVGSCDALNINPFDTIVKNSDDFSRRIARNQQNILLEESHLNAVVDPAGGSWYIETLTFELANKAWELFQSVEKDGGIIESLKDNSIFDQINQSHNWRMKNLSTRKDNLIGTTVFANLIEKALEDKNADQNNRDLSTSDLALKINKLSAVNPSELIVNPIPRRRLAQAFETLRKASEKAGNPKAFLAAVGSLAQIKARMDFSAGFFQVAGFDVISNNAFENADSALDQALASNAKVIVLCASDDDYPALVPDFMNKLKTKSNDKIIVLAGYPKDYIETFSNEGISFFIHMKSDIIQTLSDIMKKIGTKHSGNERMV